MTEVEVIELLKDKFRVKWRLALSITRASLFDVVRFSTPGYEAIVPRRRALADGTEIESSSSQTQAGKRRTKKGSILLDRYRSCFSFSLLGPAGSETAASEAVDVWWTRSASSKGF